MPQPTLTYFNFNGGRGEDCRLALHIAGVPFTDNRIAGKQWAELKPTTAYGGLPTLEIPGLGTLSQSNAILGYIGRNHGLLPTDAFEAARHEGILLAVEELRWKGAPSGSEKDPDKKKALREELASGYLQRWAAAIEKQIGDGPFFGGDTISVADLKVFVMVAFYRRGGMDHIEGTVFDAFGKLIAHHDAVKAHPAVQSWYAAH